MGIGDDILNTDGHPMGLPGANADDLVGVDQVAAAGPETRPHGIDVPESDHPCFSFPQLELPQFAFAFGLPTLTLPELCCSNTSAPAFGQGGFLSGFQLPGITIGTNYDHGDPRVAPRTGSDQTIVSTPTEPQHISKEIVKVAPSTQLDILGEFQGALIAAAMTPQHIADFIKALGDKAAALGDAGAKALGNGMAGLLNGLDDGVDWATALPSSGLAAAANQAASMVPLRQIPTGIRNPNKKHRKHSSFTSSGLRSDWPNQPGGGPTDFIGNALKLGQDLFNAVGGQCLLANACESLSRSAGLTTQGLGLAALGMQLDGMSRMGLLNPLNMDGANRLLHGWRFDCGLKHNPPPAVHRPDQVREKLSRAGKCPTGAMPGNLLYAAFGDDPAPEDSIVARAPVAIAARLGSPYTSEIAKFVNDPDPRYDSLAGSLPAYYQAGDPRMANLLRALLAFQQVVELVVGLLSAEVTDLQKHETEVGGSLVYFVVTVRKEAPRLQPINKFATNFMANRLTNEQQDLLQSLGGLWDDLNVDLNLITDVNRQDIIQRILEPRDVLAGSRLDQLIADAPDALDNFGEHVGPELAYAASNQAIMTRSLLLIEKSEGKNEKETVNRIARMASTASEHAEEVTFGNAQNDYVKSLASVDTGLAADMVEVGMPAAVAATQKQVNHQQQTMAAAVEMLAQARGGTTVGAGEEANEINHLKENNDTQAYLTGALEHQHETVKKVLTKSLPSVAGSAKKIKDAGISDAPDARATHVERIIKETSNALASTTLAKTTGVKLDQQSEGRVQQAKFILLQGGSSVAFEAPVIRSSARVAVTQGQIVLTEADAYDVRAQWEYHLVDKAIGLMTKDYHVTAKGKLVQTAKTAKYFGQEGTEIADKDHITINVGNMAAQIHATSTTLVVQIGAACIVMDPSGRIDMNPTVKPTPQVVDNKYTEAPTLDMTSDKTASVLPTKGQRNPVPCAAPYAKPGDVMSSLGL